MKFANDYFENLEDFLNLESKRFQKINLSESYKFCEELTKNHYENFPVASFLLPKQERRFIYSIYAFARFSDDIADSPKFNLSKSERVAALEKLEKNLSSLVGHSIIINPIFLALKDTIEKKELPLEPFYRLLTAFKMDVNFVQPKSWDDLENYCSFSANPIGELVLRIFNEFNDKIIVFSNYICTGLQLVNFWQDLSIDLHNDRVYIPENFFEKYKLSKESLFEIENKHKVELCLNDLLKRTQEYFFEGWKLVWHLRSNRLKIEINATILGGMRILRKEEKLGANLLFKRPRLNVFDYFYIFANSFV